MSRKDAEVSDLIAAFQSFDRDQVHAVVEVQREREHDAVARRGR